MTDQSTNEIRGTTFSVTARMLRLFLPGQGRPLVFGFLLALAASVAGLLQPWPLKLVIDSVIGDHPVAPAFRPLTDFLSRLVPAGIHPTVGLLTALCITLLLIEVVMGICHVVSAYFLTSVALRMVFKLRCALFDHVQRQSLAFHDSKAVGDSLYRITWDSYCIQAIFSEGLMPALTSGLTLLGIACVMIARDWRVTLAGLVVAVPLLILV